MSALNNPRVTAIDGGYRVANPDAGGFLLVHRRSADTWAAFFDTAEPGGLHPAGGISGSFSADVEETLAWALRNKGVPS